MVVLVPSVEPGTYQSTPRLASDHSGDFRGTGRFRRTAPAAVRAASTGHYCTPRVFFTLPRRRLRGGSSTLPSTHYCRSGKPTRHVDIDMGLASGSNIYAYAVTAMKNAGFQISPEDVIDLYLSLFGSYWASFARARADRSPDAKATMAAEMAAATSLRLT